MEKVNIAEILKDCPIGMELDCAMYEDVYFDYVDELNIIHCYIPHTTHTTSLVFNQYGTPNSDTKSKCVIFPKGKTTWEGFVPPCEFKDGDVLVHTQNGRFIMSIYKSPENEKLINTHVIFWDREEGLSVGMQICCYTDSVRFATKEEKAKLFDAIKDNGYKWNPETKTLEKLIAPKFKVGDKVVKKGGVSSPVSITGIGDEYYYSSTESSVGVLSIAEQDDWELVPNKFDVTNFEPFMKVLVRSDNSDVWECDFFSSYNPKCSNRFHCIGAWYNICIPYIGNEHLRGTTDDCVEYYKNW